MNAINPPSTVPLPSGRGSLVDTPADCLAVTFFENFAASSKREELWSLDALARHIARTTATEKRKLPWLKLAIFGDQRTDKNSLRHDSNVLDVTGLEADYDAETMSFDDAVETVTKAGILALFYTSPSHSEDRPRWRVLCPFSQPMPTNSRGKLLGRLNGLYRGIFSSESWTVSQAYYFGSVASNPAHRVEVIDGTPIDLHDDLDAIWQGKPNTNDPASNRTGHSGPLNEDELLAQIVSGESYHQPAVRLLGRWARDGVSYLDARQRLIDAMETVPLPDRTARWHARRGDIDRCVEDIYGKAAAKRDGTDGGRTRPLQHGSWPNPDLALATSSSDPAPELPLADVFPDNLGRWITSAADAAGAPADYVAGALLAAAGGCIGNARWAQPKEGWQEPPVVNVALIGRPSAGKSPALDQVVNPLHAIEAEMNDDWRERKRHHATDKAAAEERRDLWRSKVKKAAKDGNAPPMMPVDAEEPEPPQKHRLVSTDPTVAKAERMSAGNPRGLMLVRDELAGWIAGMDRFGSGAGGSDRAFWLQAQGGRPWSPDRVKDGDAEVSVPHLTWSVVGGIQPDRLASLLLAGDDDGLAARFIYLWPEAQAPRWSEADGDLAQGKAWLSRLRSLPWTPPEPVLLPFSRSAQTALQNWRQEVACMEEGAAGLFLSWLGKLPGFAVRLATILAHLEWAADPIDADAPKMIEDIDVRRAVIFLSAYAVPMARRAFGEAALPEAERDARRLARWLLKQQPRPTTLNVRELRRMANGPGIANAARVMAALDELAALSWVRASPGRDGEHHGRPRNDWTVNPALAGGGPGLA